MTVKKINTMEINPSTEKIEEKLREHGLTGLSLAKMVAEAAQDSVNEEDVFSVVFDKASAPIVSACKY
jgi:hypothetical protein